MLIVRRSSDSLAGSRPSDLQRLLLLLLLLLLPLLQLLLHATSTVAVVGDSSQ